MFQFILSTNIDNLLAITIKKRIWFEGNFKRNILNNFNALQSFSKWLKLCKVLYSVLYRKCVKDALGI